jgi:hypothetical protein
VSSDQGPAAGSGRSPTIQTSFASVAVPSKAGWPPSRAGTWARPPSRTSQPSPVATAKARSDTGRDVTPLPPGTGAGLRTGVVLSGTCSWPAQA